MEATLSQARCLLDLGWDVIPLLKKSPAVADWTALPPKNIKQIEKQLKLWNSQNIGVRLGKHSKLKNGLFLACIDGDIDTDSKDEIDAYAAAWKEILSRFNNRPPMAVTGSNPLARHCYVAVPEEVGQLVLAKSSTETLSTSGGKTSSKPLWTITLYASAGRQMVLPPSVHPATGRLYQWEKAPVIGAEVPRLPETFLKKLRLKAEKEKAKVTALGMPDFASVVVHPSRFKVLSPQIQKEISDNEGIADRSSALLVVAGAMYQAKFTDAEVLSVLTDPSHAISQVAQKHRHQGGLQDQAAWVWKYTCQKARKSRVEDSFEPIATEEITPPNELATPPLSDFVQGALKGVRRSGKAPFAILNTIENVVTILRNVSDGRPDWVGRDLFTRRDVYRMDTPWGGVNGAPLHDEDNIRIAYYLSKEFNYNPAFETIDRAVKFTCVDNKFHSGQEFLEGLKWDGVRRIDTWLKDYLGACEPQGELLREISRKIMLAIVARQLEPGIKFDYVLLLKGGQGIGKSSAVDILNGRSAIGRIDPDRPADSVLCMVGQRVVELAECWTLAKRESESVKAFFSAPSDNIRAPYERRPELYPRQSIFIGTTNRDDFLQDSTGERRYWVVEVTQCDFDGFARDRDQLFAEAMNRWALEREDLWLTDKSATEMTDFQDQFKQTDAVEEVLAEALARDDGEVANAAKKGCLTIHTIFRFYPELGRVADTRAERRVGEALRKLGFVKKPTSFQGEKGKFWRRK